MNIWIVIQWGYAVFGHGLTPEAAIADAKEWIDKDDPEQSWTVGDFKTNLHTAVDGELVLCRVEDYREYYKEMLEMEIKSLVVFFDNGGGITIQTETYCHFYQDPKHAATDVAAILDGKTTLHWDGNEPEHRLEEAEVQHDLIDIIRIKSKPFDKHNHSGLAETEFYQTLLN